ncbi:MAG: ABC transporter ATP-binding protein [Dechloromonas sp.]|uniref:ABC transporter ATP-binding protein n=1 Tax=Dechloromonas sp. TaxID=1917218 RepID=UPI0027F74B53|nr:ABC transporter ATP-binding protein [Dechloromonas sp.]MBT9519989.1 ABC transporter ATP-binding protein [Dechloromonas sp.]
MYRWISPYFLLERRRLVFVFLLSMVAISLSLMQPLLTKNIIDDGIVSRDVAQLLIAGFGMFLVAILAPFVGYYTRRNYIHASAGVLHEMKERLFEHILKMDMRSIGKYKHGDLITRLEGDLSELQRFATDSILSAINALVIIVGTVAILGVMNLTLTIVMLTVFAINMKYLNSIKPKLHELSKSTRDVGVAISSFLHERIGQIKHIKTFNAQSRELNILRLHHNDLKHKTMELQSVGYFASAIPNLLVTLAVIVLFVGGGVSIINGNEITLGVLVAFTSYSQRISGPLQTLSGIFVGWQRAKVSLVRVHELLSISDEHVAKRKSSAPTNFGESAVIVAVGIAYKNPNEAHEIFGNISFSVFKNSKVLIKAPSGFGKSILVDIFHGHLKPSMGNIWILGKNIEEYDPELLRKIIVVVSQQSIIFSGSLAENVRYGIPEATDQDVIYLLELVGLRKLFCSSLDGINMQVGINGANLSGGEKQRVALARAILLKPQILIIDEGTSGLDIELEEKIFSGIETVLQRTTKIIVSHRPHPREKFDQVIDLDLLSKKTSVSTLVV